MSDAETVRFYLDKRDDLAGWLALNRLEARVWALQDERASLESQNQALQEAPRVLLEDAVYMHKEHGARDDCRAISRARQILSPTQETDPDASM